MTTALQHEDTADPVLSSDGSLRFFFLTFFMHPFSSALGWGIFAWRDVEKLRVACLSVHRHRT